MMFIGILYKEIWINGILWYMKQMGIMEFGVIGSICYNDSLC